MNMTIYDYVFLYSKVQGLVSKLSKSEKEAISMFVKFSNKEDDIDTISSSDYNPFKSLTALLEAKDNRDKRENSTKVNNHLRSVSHISPTSNICERLFSRSKLVMTANRRSMDPTTLENIMMLRCSKDLWDARTIEMIREIEERERKAQRKIELQRKALEEQLAQINKRKRSDSFSDSGQDDDLEVSSIGHST